MSKRMVGIHTVLRRNGRLCQISDIDLREGPVMWDTIVEICVKPGEEGEFVEVDWNDLRQEIDTGKTKVIDMNKVCQDRGLHGCDNSCPFAGWC